MSIGHRRSGSKGEDWLWSDEELKAAEKYLLSEVETDHDHDVPYTAGYSRNAKTVYYDKEVPEWLDVKAKGSRTKTVKVNLWITFGFHETTEKSLEDEPYNIPYQFAHQCALRLEQALVEAYGADWDDYNKKTTKLVNDIYARKEFPNMPEDLDPEPMEEEDDQDILDQMK